VEPNDWLANKSLIEAGLSREGVLILGIQRKGGFYIGAPQGVSRMHIGDVLVMYGPIDRLEELDRRRAGPEGDHSHQDAVVAHQAELKAQAELDELQKPQKEQPMEA
jgi:uncharacterized protein with PhoU and TrkA domain